MNILDTIVAHKKEEVAARSRGTSVSELYDKPFFNRPTLSLKKFLSDPARTGIIAEYKRRSPSKGLINGHSTVEEVTAAYARHASGISVLTDEQFFGGTLNDLVRARVNEVPLLRKDFMISDYQLMEARAYGADVILLIAACLTIEQTRELAAKAKELGLEVLLEIHDETELPYINDDVDMVGVNNRNLKTFEVSIQRSLDLIKDIPSSKAAVAESGISDVETIVSLKRAGFKGFLVGENFMKHADPAIAFADFVHRLKAKNEN
jgi:indole-3-glycerol phosphate synthase